MQRHPLLPMLCAVICGTALLRVEPAQEVEAPLDPAAAARRFRRLVIPGEQVRGATDRLLRELDWQDDLTAAARIARHTGRPILWVQAVGDLRGVL